MALSSRSLALDVIQQVWSFGSPDFPQNYQNDSSATACAYSLPNYSVILDRIMCPI
ncbi:hypothetical protein LC593_11425 [Nostoc sp. CHAB 5844]|nr:hypothetical protein [Nostoc sp. CHAB 5844]